MSGIMEKNLPVAEEVTSENLIRTVSEEGNSQNMTVEQLGGLVGGGVEKIELGTANGGGSIIEGTGILNYSGYISFPNNATLYDLVGEKSIIGFELTWTTRGLGLDTTTLCRASYSVEQDYISVIGIDKNEKQGVTSLNISGFLTSVSEGSHAVTVYAICI